MFFDCEDGKIRSELDEERDRIIKKINDALDEWHVFLNKNEEDNIGFYMKAINYQPHCVNRNKWEFLTYDEYEKRMVKKMQAFGHCEEVTTVIHCDSSEEVGYPVSHSLLADMDERVRRLESEAGCCAEACPGR